MKVVDFLRWLEFSLGGRNGPLFKPVIEQRDHLPVPVIAQEFNATFWTQDADYEGLDGVQYFAKA